MNVTVIAAFIGGVLTVFAPCGAMLLPAFFAYAFTSRTTLLGRTGLFFLGLVSVLLPLGVAAGSLGGWLTRNSTVLVYVLAGVVIVFGLAQVFGVSIPAPKLGRKPKPGQVQADTASPWAVYLLGVTFGLAGGGCSGPILGGVLAAAAFGGSPLWGGVLLLCYAAGMFAPVMVMALLWVQFKVGERVWLKPKPLRLLGRDTTVANVIAGVIMVALGVFLVVNPSGLGSMLNASTQASIENKVLSMGEIIPGALFIALLVAIVGLLVVLLRKKTKQNGID